MTRFCMRCDEPIREDELYETVDKFSPTGAGATLYVHKRRCEEVPTQTAPARSW